MCRRLREWHVHYSDTQARLIQTPSLKCAHGKHTTCACIMLVNFIPLALLGEFLSPGRGRSIAYAVVRMPPHGQCHCTVSGLLAVIALHTAASAFHEVVCLQQKAGYLLCDKCAETSMVGYRMPVMRSCRFEATFAAGVLQITTAGLTGRSQRLGHLSCLIVSPAVLGDAQH